MTSLLHFGWIQFNEDGSCNTTIEGEPLDPTQVAEIERYLSFLAKNRISLIEYLVCDANYKLCEQLSSDLTEIAFGEKNIVANSTSAGVRMYALLDQRTSAFISSCSTFRDRLLKREGASRKSDHPLIETLSNIYDANFEYRLFYNLRNIGLHQESIFRNLPVAGDWIQKDKFQVNLLMDPSALQDALSKGNGQKLVRDELGALSNEIDFVHSAKKYLFHMKNLFFVYLLNQGDELINFLHFFRTLKAGVRGSPPGAMLLLFSDFDPAASGMQDCKPSNQNLKATLTSMDEAEIYLALFPEFNPSET